MIMQRAVGAVYRTTNRLVWCGSRSYCFEPDRDFDTDREARGHMYEKCVNKVTLLGRIGNDPYFSTGASKFSNFPLATSIVYKPLDTDESKQVTTWHQVHVRRPHILARLHDIGKGSRVYVEGKVETRTWKDADGNQQTRASIYADDLIVLARKQKEEYSNDDDAM